MERSLVYRHFDFLKELGLADVQERKDMIAGMTIAEMRALSEVVYDILNKNIGVLQIDERDFGEKKRVLRHLITPRISFGRKKAVLYRYHVLVPHLMRDWYLIQVVISRN